MLNPYTSRKLRFISIFHEENNLLKIKRFERKLIDDEEQLIQKYRIWHYFPG